MEMLPPAIRRVPPRLKDETNEWDIGDDGRYIATFLLAADAGPVYFSLHLPWREDAPPLADIEAEARAALKAHLSEIVSSL